MKSFCFDCGRKTKYFDISQAVAYSGFTIRFILRALRIKSSCLKYSLFQLLQTHLSAPSFLAIIPVKCVKPVIFRNGNKYVRLVSLRLAQCFKVSTAPAYAPYIIIILNSVADFNSISIRTTSSPS